MATKGSLSYILFYYEAIARKQIYFTVRKIDFDSHRIEPQYWLG